MKDRFISNGDIATPGFISLVTNISSRRDYSKKISAVRQSSRMILLIIGLSCEKMRYRNVDF